MFETQLYSIGLTALWFYDYFLTLADEVVEFHNDKDAENNLITLHSFVMHGMRRALLVSEPPHFLGVRRPTTFQYSSYFYS